MESLLKNFENYKDLKGEAIGYNFMEEAINVFFFAKCTLQKTYKNSNSCIDPETNIE